MGRFDEAIERTLTDNELFQQIRAAAMLADEQVHTTKCYIFGSATRDIAHAADIDLLVICQNSADADRLRRIYNQFPFCRPLDLSILTEEEEAEVCFVASQHCIEIFPSDD